MLSILIPTYNYDVSNLVKAIDEQCLQLKITYEIIIIDDGSNSPLNEVNNKLNTLEHVTFKALSKNIGRSRIRNLLAKKANYKWLLFIDGDSLIINPNYIKKYVNSVSEKIDVIYGGRIHSKHMEKQRKLRWKYGKFHEDSNSTTRLKIKYKSILFNNTIISRNTFNKIYFNKNIMQYGHEDTLFAYQLSVIKANVTHIDNPVLNDDVDLNSVFFNKMHKSIQNLNYIYKNNMINVNFITFLKFYNKLKKYNLHYFFSFIHTVFYPLFKYNLTSNYPFLFVFNLFRLSYFCHISLKK